jgi:hypothetical protein
MEAIIGPLRWMRLMDALFRSLKMRDEGLGEDGLAVLTDLYLSVCI